MRLENDFHLELDVVFMVESGCGICVGVKTVVCGKGRLDCRLFDLFDARLCNFDPCCLHALVQDTTLIVWYI